MDKTIKWLIEIPGKRKINIVILSIVQVVNGIIGVYYAVILRNIVDYAVNYDRPGFVWEILYLIVFMIIQLIIRAFIHGFGELSKAELENGFKIRLMQMILNKDFFCVSAIHSAEWMNRLTNDAVIVANGYVEIIPGFMEMLIKLISVIVMIVYLDKQIAVFLLVCGFVLIFFSYPFRNNLKQLSKSVQEADGRLRIILQECINGLLAIKSFTAESYAFDKIGDRMIRYKQARIKRNIFSNVCNIGFGIVMSGMYVMGVVYCGTGILKGIISVGTFVAVIQLVSQVQTPLVNITGYVPRFFACVASAERLIEAEKFSEDVQDSIYGDPVIKNLYQTGFTSFGFENVSFSYPVESDDIESEDRKEKPIIKDLSIEIFKGEKVAFVGHSGCGKTTALKLLMCIFKPDKGMVFYQDSVSKKLMDYRMRGLFAYVPQGNILMNGSVREIICFSNRSDVDDDSGIWEALHIACADEFIGELDDGLDTELGEKGYGLSEGQMQRLAIARAVFSDRPILLLDEATSALDVDIESKIIENINGLLDKTVILVSHRKTTLKFCDRIIEFV